MDQHIKDKVKGTLLVVIVLAIALVSFSMLLGWSLWKLFVFWFMITPGLAAYLPRLVSNNKSHLFESLTGLLIFYAIMVWMIYDHYMTDYFRIMMLSCILNVILVWATNWEVKRRMLSH